MPTLYVVATPIGNLEDITLRAQRVLTSVPVVFAEDTRRTKTLLQHLGAMPMLVSYHQHTTPGKLQSLLDTLAQNDVALVTDAGTPGVNDPGGRLVEAALKRFGDDLAVVPVPGPSAIIAAASVSGLPMDSFVFLGFPPHKKGRQTFFDEAASIARAVIFYESVHRIQKAMQEIATRQPERAVVVCREITKQFETTYRGTAREVAQLLAHEKPRGEYVVVLAPQVS